MPSYKTAIIERLFMSRWDAFGDRLRDPVVTLQDVQAEIRDAIERGVRASDKNAANFLYDIIRTPSANEIWPSAVFSKGYTGRQLVGTGQCFEFVRVAPGDTEPFPNPFAWDELTPRFAVESLSLPLLIRELAPTDEMAILQMAVTLRLAETHFAIRSRQAVAELVLLQTSVKFSNVVIDALFAASIMTSGGILIRALVTCESKQHNERILGDRILRQVEAADNVPIAHDLVIPIVIQRVPNCGIYVAEFEPITPADALYTGSLRLASNAIYELTPAIVGF